LKTTIISKRGVAPTRRVRRAGDDGRPGFGVGVGETTAVVSAFDAAAPNFNRHRALSNGVAEAIRSAVIAVAGGMRRSRLLDIGAGAGRIGHTFVTAGDNYVGVDLSFGMLRAFLHRATWGGASPGPPPPRLVRADGRYLPFRDATFDVVMMIQIFGGMRDFRLLVSEARRVLRPSGAMILGRMLAAQHSIDARLRQRLALILSEIGIDPGHNFHDEVEQALNSAACSAESVVAASWRADRTAREFLERHRTGARFSALSGPVQKQALRQLAVWAVVTFGSLDAVFSQPYAFQLQVFKFGPGVPL
jgi:ubiquinone/menaquinone biosynthesis C-methylase UbiE